MITKRNGLSELLGSGGTGLFHQLDTQVGGIGTGHKVLLNGRSLVKAQKTHEELHMDALRRWLQGCDEALEEWLSGE
ncbi:MAG: hypothetical protein ACE5QW_08340 [Thermoplasmata archaeon]